MSAYVVAAIKPWNVAAFEAFTPGLPGSWHLITTQEGLTAARLQAIAPEWVFCPHWSWKIPAELLRAHRFLGFHMTDLPYGRGGSPLQNLILRGHRRTQVCLLRLAEELDSGPVYLRRPLDLSGSAQDIFERFARLSYEMIETFLSERPEPSPQEGEVVTFRRRRPEESRLPPDPTASQLYDHIRMLDAETYPPAFVEIQGLRLEFRQAVLEGEELSAKVTVRVRRGEDNA